MSTPPSLRNTPTTRHVPLGGRVLAILTIAYRALRPALLMGPPGIGKSELLHQLAKMLGIEILVLDLSLCEPSDLVGLPRVDGGRTRFAPPASLPTKGKGILVLEELNRAEKFIQSPVLQLLTARRLNDYVLPPGWWCCAAINPDDGVNDVRALDPAMLTRFVQVPVCADRSEWLIWARTQGVHPAVVHVVASDPTSLDTVSPRSWKFASDLLNVMTADERHDQELLYDALAGALPEAWTIRVTEAMRRVRDGDLIAVDLLRHMNVDPQLQKRVEALRDAGRTDVLRALAHDLLELLSGPIELARMVAQSEFSFESFETVLGLLPGDLRSPLQDALAGNIAALRLLDVDFADLLANGYQGRGYDWKVQEWQRDELLAHRIGLFLTGLCHHLRADANLTALRRANGGRRALGALLADLRPRHHQRLLDCLCSLNVEPILADRRN